MRAAYNVAAQYGPAGITRLRVARRAKCAPALVSYHFGSMGGLMTELVAHAAARGEWRFLAGAIAMRHPSARDLPEGVRARALASLTGPET
jgi:AcrR family transcriptional regulator